MNDGKKVSTKTLKTALIIMGVLTIAALGYTAWRLGEVNFQFIISAAITIAVFILIIVIYRIWKSNFFIRATVVINELRNFSSIFNDNSPSYETTISFLRRKQDECFTDPFLKECLKQYLDEIERLEVESSESYRCDISDYVNYDDICSYIKKAFAENIAASMTGIGILGTFIGLAVGLQSFDASNMSSMENSISPLIDGIKTAFYTSIYGVVMSLLMNHCIKNVMHEMDVALDDFYDAFYENVLAYPEYSIQKQSLQIQVEQRDIMANFAETMAVSLSREMKELMVPLFEKMTDTLNEFSINVANSQTEGMEKIVDGFLEGMNQSLGNQFDELSQVIQDTCNWQQQSMSSMDGVIDKIKDEAVNISEINDKLQSTIVIFEEYMEKLVVQENTLSAQLDVYEDTLETTMKALSDAQSNMDGILEKQQELANASEVTNNALKESIETAENLRNVMQCDTKDITCGSITDKNLLMDNLKTNCVPEDVFEMDETRYEEFLDKRALLMSNKIRKYYESL